MKLASSGSIVRVRQTIMAHPRVRVYIHIHVPGPIPLTKQS